MLIAFRMFGRWLTVEAGKIGDRGDPIDDDEDDDDEPEPKFKIGFANVDE